MVLQRTQPAIVFGFAAPATVVKTTFKGATLSATADASGVWRQALPPQSATASGQAISFSCSTGETFALVDVLFGDLHICGGQSNMQFTVGCIGEQLGYDANAEIADANNYPHIRTMTVLQTTTSYDPMMELPPVAVYPWAVASNLTIGHGNWSATSAVCWFYARDLYDATQVPVGIVGSNWGGTIIQSWSDNATNAECSAHAGADPARLKLADGVVDSPEQFADPGHVAAAGVRVGQPSPNNGHGVLFNAMIHPFTVGPMAVTTFIWFQGESNCCNGPYYTCAQNAMIEMWRTYFNNPAAFFGFVELEPWIGTNPTLAAFRVAQRDSLKLPNVGYAVGTDIGDPTGPFTSIHPRNKKLVGKRLAAAALSIAYKTPTQYMPPVYKSSSVIHVLPNANGTAIAVTVAFDNVVSKLVAAEDHCKTELKVPVVECAWFSITLSDKNATVVNATATIGADGKSVVLTATAPAAGLTAASTSFGMNGWPINTVMSAEGFPLRPWADEACEQAV